MDDCLILKCLGKHAQLGNLYDARKNSVLNISFLSQPPDSFVKTLDCNKINYEFTLTDTYNEKFKRFGIDGSLKIALLFGLIEAKFSSSYFSDEKQSLRSIRGTCLIEIRKCVETLNLLDKSLMKLFDFRTLSNQEATHVVVGVHWGANCVSTFEFKDTNSDEKVKKSGLIGSALGGFKDIFDFILSMERVKANTSTCVKTHSDICPKQGLPTSFEETLNFLKVFPTYLKNVNNGKGIPIEIELISIKSIIEFFGLDLKFDRILKQIDNDLIQRIEIEFDSLIEKKQVINDLIEDCGFLNSKYKKYLCDLKQNVLVNQEKFKENAAKVLYDVKAGTKEQSVIVALFCEYTKSKFSSDSLETVFSSKQFLGIKQKLDFLSQIKECGIKIIDKGIYNIHSFMNSNENVTKHAYVLKISDSLKEQHKTQYEDYWRYFLSLKRTSSESVVYYVYDYDVFEGSNEGTLSIEYYAKGRLVNSDCYKTLKPVIRLRGNFEFNVKRKPQDSIALRVPCPNFEHCSKCVLEWFCERCEQKVYHDKHLVFYCDCSSSDYLNYEFKCNCSRHAENVFVRFHNLRDLKQFLLKSFE